MGEGDTYSALSEERSEEEEESSEPRKNLAMLNRGFEDPKVQWPAISGPLRDVESAFAELTGFYVEFTIRVALRGVM